MVPMQAQRSLYAQHIMPTNDHPKVMNTDGGRPFNGNTRQHSINIESMVTPIRGVPFTRQQSIQSYCSRDMKPLPANGQIKQHAASFDCAIPHSPSLTGAPNQRTTSYRHKLMQLQLLHNSNNVDYIRLNGGNHNSNNNDYQIYGPDSTATNHYGYYSMRSNLKSAASEFSFIRPSSSNLQPKQHHQATPQSSLPHQNSSYMLNNHHQNSYGQQQLTSSLITPMHEANKMTSGPLLQNDGNNSNNICSYSSQLATSIGQQQQYSFNLTTGERLINMSAEQAPVAEGRKITLAELTAPTRDLPLKPNRRRAPQNVTHGVSTSKNSSIASSIVRFFRRAFSRRSKKRSKLAESCSSSLGAFDDGFPNVQILPSAFSTGSKSIDERINHQQLNNQGAPQRMVDMIQAFNNQVQIENGGQNAVSLMGFQRESGNPIGANFYYNPRADSQLPPEHYNQNQATRMNRFGSPLHKSNSISTTMGLSSLNESRPCGKKGALLYDNAILADGLDQSPMMTRSTKVMSANLTPLFTQKEHLPSTHQLFMSSRNSVRIEHLPRPSSIYGQPSMISSPISTNNEGMANFGQHRNSLHGQLRDRANFDPRRHQMIKAPFLDTTREVAEEISSPTTESKAFDHGRGQNLRLGPTNNSSDGTNGYGLVSILPNNTNYELKHLQQHRRAVVNPILQSPTMNTIHDNHPIRNDRPMISNYSHYDNQHLTEYHTSPALEYASTGVDTLHQLHTRSELPASPIPRMFEAQGPRQSNLSDSLVRGTPSHQAGLSSRNQERSTVMDMMMANSKPAAIVAPTTPNHGDYRERDYDLCIGHSSRAGGLSSGQSSSRVLPQSTSASPVISRRLMNHHYQQSPLVNRQTRVLNRGDGVQATIIGDDQDVNTAMVDNRSIGGEGGQSVVHMAGEPGINSDPSLDASHLRGTNIDAFESSIPATTDSNAKTFLVSTRSSNKKKRANNKNVPVIAGEDTKNYRSPKAHARRGTHQDKIIHGPSRDDLSSGSYSVNSSMGRTSSHSNKVSRRSVDSSGNNQEDQQEDSISSDTHGSKSSKSSSNAGRGNSSESRNRLTSAIKNERTGSSTEHSGSRNSSLDDEVDGRNWITSKLAQ